MNTQGSTQSNVVFMSRVIARRRGTPRPNYLPTALEARLNDPNYAASPNALPKLLPSNLSDGERERLRRRGVNMDFLDKDTTRVIKLKFIGPLDTSPEKPLPVYMPEFQPHGLKHVRSR